MEQHVTRKILKAAALGVAGALTASQVHAQAASNNDQEIALLKQQLRMLEQKLDRFLGCRTPARRRSMPHLVLTQ